MLDLSIFYFFLVVNTQFSNDSEKKIVDCLVLLPGHQEGGGQGLLRGGITFFKCF